MLTANQLKIFLEMHHGMITIQQALGIGINYKALNRLVFNRKLERVNQSVYIDPLIFKDAFVLAQLRFPKGIFCCKTALYLYDMLQKAPDKLEMTFPHNYNAEKLASFHIHAYRQVNALYTLGINSVKTSSGNLVYAYNIERTLCDIIRPPHIAQVELVAYSVQKYIKQRNSNIKLLMYYAKVLHVQEKIRTFMEAML